MRNLSEELASQEFKKAARKAIFAIVFFIISYFVLLLLAIGLAAFCGFLGISLIGFKAHWITFLVGLGLVGMGLIVVVFLVKFIFKRHKVDRSHLIALKVTDAPLLYQEIREIVSQVQTDFPKKIYVSHEVNASVFYDSTFWSMIFPVRKNLQIGMALVNTVSKNELKAILAHEFGHFSQRSMKVGSYVYTVNQIIYNMLYDNEGYGKLIQRFANISNYFALFANLGIKIIEGVQWILKKLYNVVNLQHLSLSREMEFHADAIAANTVGKRPFISSMMRLDLSNTAFDRTLGYYEQKIGSNIKPENIYPQHQFVMNILAQDAGIEFVNGLPNVTTEHINRYNKSKLVIKNQWASHPSTEDRIAAVAMGNFPEGEDDGEPATVLFADAAAMQAAVTSLLFSNVEFKGEVSSDDIDLFKKTYEDDFKANGFPAIFNGYYDNHNPIKIDLEQSTVNVTLISFDQLYAVDKKDMLYTASSLELDIHTLKQIQTQQTDIKSFEYDGRKYQKREIAELLPKLELELDEVKALIVVNDALINAYFMKVALENGRADVYLEKYKVFIAFDKTYEEVSEVYTRAVEQTQFIQYTTPFDQITTNFEDFARTEIKLREQIQRLLALPLSVKISPQAIEKLEKYLSKEKPWYFLIDEYMNSELEMLFDALDATREAMYTLYFESKKSLLDEMENLKINFGKEVLA